MGNNNELRDGFIHTMMKQTGLESPSEKFTSQLMGKIQKESATVLDDSPIIGMKYWLLIGASLIAAAYILFFSNINFMSIGIGDMINTILVEGVSLNFIGSLKNLIGSVSIPPILIISMMAILSLIGLDRFIKYKFNANLFMI